jgi:Leucine-rich repeat (LRR) protein
VCIRQYCLLIAVASTLALIGKPSQAVDPIPGDLNGDGRVDLKDQLILTNEWYSQNRSDPVIAFTDETLELVTRGILKKPTEEIHASDLARIDSLQIPSSLDINSLGDLEHFGPLKNFSVRRSRPNDSPLDLSPLAFLNQLQTLQLSRFGGLLLKVTDVSPIGTLTRLTNLVLTDSPITSSSSFANLINLVELQISKCNLLDIPFISSLDQLLTLNLQGNEITDISPLQSLVHLRVLEVGNNNILNIDPLANLSNLKVIGLGCNQITNIKPLVDNPGIGMGDVVQLGGNPLDDISKNTYIPALEARGVDVSFPLRVICTPLNKEDQ